MAIPITNIPDKQTLKGVFGSFTGMPVRVTTVANPLDPSKNILHVPDSTQHSTAGSIRKTATRLGLCPVFIAAGNSRDMFDQNCLTVELDKDACQIWRISKFTLGRDTVLDEVDLSVGDNELTLNKKMDVKQPLRLKRK